MKEPKKIENEEVIKFLGTKHEGIWKLSVVVKRSCYEYGESQTKKKKIKKRKDKKRKEKYELEIVWPIKLKCEKY